MEITPKHYYGSAQFSETIAPKASAAVQVTADGAERGPCTASIDPPVESASYSISAHVDSYGVVLVVIRNESEEEMNLSGTLNVVCVEGLPASAPAQP